MKEKNKIFGFVSEDEVIAFGSNEDAEKYNKLYYGGYARVREMKFYSSLEEFEKINPRKHLLRLCREKSQLLSINFPFQVVRFDVVREYEKISLGSSFLNLKEMLSLANEELKRKYKYPQDVKDDEKVKIQIKNDIIELTARQFMTLNTLFKETCLKVNDLNKKIASVLDELHKKNISEEEYKAILKEGRISEANEGTEPQFYEFEMLEKDRYKERDYMLLE